jgi:hypothetical protein
VEGREAAQAGGGEARDLVLGIGAVGVPERGGDRRGGALAELARGDLNVVASLEQDERGAQACDAAADDEDLVGHGPGLYHGARAG